MITAVIFDRDGVLIDSEEISSNWGYGTEVLIKVPIMRQPLVQKGFFFHGAPAVIFVIADDPVDAALAPTNMGTMAEAQGLGVLYVGFFAMAARVSKKIRKKLSLTGKEKVVTAIAIGYPDVHYKRTVPRKKAKVKLLRSQPYILYSKARSILASVTSLQSSPLTEKVI